MEREKQWYIVNTRGGNELKTLYTLKKKHIECFCLLSTSTAHARHKSAMTALLPNYIFIHMTPEEQAGMRRIEGVVSFMYWLGEPVVVKEEDIFIMKELIEQYQIVATEKIKVDATVSSEKVWKTAPVKNNGIEEDADFVKVFFPAYGFAVAAKEKDMNVRVINIGVKKSRQETAGIQYSK